MFCKKCEKIIKARIKYLESLDKGRKTPDYHRAIVIEQLEYLLQTADDILATGKMGRRIE
jgi:hypothetical protein